MDYLKIWTSFRELLEPLADDERGRLFTAMLLYAETGEEPILDGNERYVWPAARQSIDRTRQDSVNAAKGGASPREPKPTASNRSQPTSTEPNRREPKPTDTNRRQPKATEANYKDKDKDKEKILDDDDTARAREDTVVGSVDLDPLIVKVQQELNGLTDTHYHALEDYRRDLGDELVGYAIDLAVGNGTRNWNYVEAILRGWLTLHIHTVGEAKAEHERHKDKPKQPPKLVRAQQYGQREYSETKLRTEMQADDIFSMPDDEFDRRYGKAAGS